MDPEEYAEFDGLGLAALVEQDEVSPKELAEAALTAIERVNPEINAVVEIYHDRISDLDESTLPEGPFCGVPFLMKDTGAMLAGRKTEWGSRLCEGHVASQDANYVKLLKAAGVNILGRTNVPEFCIAGTTENRLYGNTSTPWKSGYSAGGSTGGGAAAVAAGMVPIAHGSDIGGSIRIPAAWCGGVGLKPSRGRVSAGPALDEGGYGMTQNFVQTRTVRDCAAMLDVLGAPQPGDPFVIRQPQNSFLNEIDGESDTLKIAFSASSMSGDPVDPEIAAAVEAAAELLEEMGHEVEEAAPPWDIDAVMETFQAIWFFGYFKLFDGLAEKLGRTIGPETLEPVTLAIYEASKSADPYAFPEALGYLNTVRRSFGTFFSNYDIWLTPTAALPPEPNGLYGLDLNMGAKEYIRHSEKPIQFCVPYNMTGLPAISLPLAETSDGLPFGLQLGTRHGEEARILRLAAELEDAVPWAERVPPLHVSQL